MDIYLDALSRVPAGSIGTQAFIISSINIIKSAYPDARLIMLSCYPDMDKEYFGDCNSNVEIVPREKSQLGTIKQVINIVKKVDVVISVWGDGYVFTSPHKILYKTAFLSSSRKPTILFPSSIGPFNGLVKKYLARKGIEHFDKVMVRDTTTLKYFEQIGIKNALLVPDVAFILEPANDQRIKEIFDLEKIPFSRDYIGLNISQLLNFLYKKENKSYPQLMADVVDYLIETFGKNVLLIPHQIYPTKFERYYPNIFESYDGDDRFAIQEVFRLVRNRGSVFTFTGEYTSLEYKGIISKNEVFIGGRMHSIIGALSLSIPSLIIQYSHKASGLMELLDLDSFLWDYHQTKEVLIDKINLLWEQKNTVRSNLMVKMKKIKNEVWDIKDILKNTIEKYR